MIVYGSKDVHLGLHSTNSLRNLANVEVLPGDPYTLVAELEDPLLVAGEFTRVFCSAFDEFGNVLIRPT